MARQKTKKTNNERLRLKTRLGQIIFETIGYKNFQKVK